MLTLIQTIFKILPQLRGGFRANHNAEYMNTHRWHYPVKLKLILTFLHSIVWIFMSFYIRRATRFRSKKLIRKEPRSIDVTFKSIAANGREYLLLPDRVICAIEFNWCSEGKRGHSANIRLRNWTWWSHSKDRDLALMPT